MVKIAEIHTCNECPYFDDSYYTYRQHCMLLDRKIPKNTFTDIYYIPDDCPLPTKE